ncbi:MAG: GNAT family N-acetyltransferase [Dehalococcoidia bacterium]|nr:GNAT family N-acetyltransferase [Dehalococcoidia bacterium]
MVRVKLFRGAAVAQEKTVYVVRRLEERDEIRRRLEEERIYAAYALAQLEAGAFERSEWWLSRGDGGEALLMHSKAGLGNALVALGDAPALAAALSLHPGPQNTFATFRLEHLDVMRRCFILAQSEPMARMVVTRDAFEAAPTLEAEADGALVVRRLDERDIGRVNRLYRSEGSHMEYRAHHLRGNVYFGLFEDGRLVSVAGTHSIARESGIAVVGNVFTHPLYRDRHYGLRVTSAVTEALLETCPEVALTVHPENAPAVRAYARLGYQQDCEMIEAGASRKDILGLGSLFRRLLARRRGRGPGEEIVISS